MAARIIEMVDDDENLHVPADPKPADTPAPAPAPTPAPAPAPATPPQDDEIPEKFKGKSAAEIAKAYKDLEQHLGRQGHEIGELRQTLDLAIKSSLVKPATAPAPAPADTTDDDSTFFINPRKAIAEAVESHPLVKELKQRSTMTQQERAQAAFEKKHPDSKAILSDPEFREWVQASPIRTDLLVRADRDFDFAAGDEVFSLYKAIKGVKAPAVPAVPDTTQAEKEAAEAATRQEALRAGTVPSGNAAPSGDEGKKVYSRRQLINLKITNPEKYESMSKEIELAYLEGRVRS